MKRILEPEVMDTPEEAIAYDAMDFIEINTAFVDRLIELGANSGHFLDLGTGPARIPILLSQHFHNVKITAIDLSENMLKIASRHIAEADLADRITLRTADAKDLPFPDQTFDGIFSNSIIHHIPDPIDVMREVSRLIKPNGLIFIRDLLRLESADEIEAIVDLYAENDTEYQRELFRDSLFASLTISEISEIVSEVGLTDVKIIQTSDRHWSIERSII